MRKLSSVGFAQGKSTTAVFNHQLSDAAVVVRGIRRSARPWAKMVHQAVRDGVGFRFFGKGCGMSRAFSCDPGWKIGPRGV